MATNGTKGSNRSLKAGIYAPIPTFFLENEDLGKNPRSIDEPMLTLDQILSRSLLILSESRKLESRL
ncbi:hypothetical protein V5O48_000483 [Marasmius crinis-equi]|uniref:Uncharacterized protein n=1 Tax=Marasmius crinis-equi TaxID=585013 RepID=A0ABR3G1L0_9AGAR